MGACLGKHRKKKNTVTPSKSAESVHRRARKPLQDMIEDLEAGKFFFQFY